MAVFIGYSIPIGRTLEEYKTDKEREVSMKRNTLILLATAALFVAAVLVVPVIAEALEPEPLPKPYCGVEGIEGCPRVDGANAPPGCIISGGGCCGTG